MPVAPVRPDPAYIPPSRSSNEPHNTLNCPSAALHRFPAYTLPDDRPHRSLQAYTPAADICSICFFHFLIRILQSVHTDSLSCFSHRWLPGSSHIPQKGRPPQSSSVTTPVHCHNRWQVQAGLLPPLSHLPCPARRPPCVQVWKM